MSEHLRDPDLDRLVHELNRRAELDGPGDGDAGAGGDAAAGDGGDLGSEGGFGAVAATGVAGPGAGVSPAAPLLELAMVPPPRASLPPAAKAQAAPAAPAELPPGEERAEAGAWLDQLPEPPPRASLEAGEALGRLLGEALRRGASDVLLLAGLPPVFRIDGRLKRGDAAPLDADDVARLFQSQLTSRVRREIAERGAADFSLRLAGPGAVRSAGL
ncbi:MAG: hypothetical protein JOZ15_22190, partial [Acidobacteria bacterium]|nr:hypothetical protein [Acidobacteriota bacterium]